MGEPEPSFAAGLVGIVLDDRYRLDALLGEGGMGAVYRAHHLAMDRRVAIKLLKPHLTSDDAALQRFAREARSTLKVDSPHAVKLLDFGITPLKDYYMVLEYLDGRTVQRELDVDGPFAPSRVLHIAKQALHALGAAHAQGLIHRDIKPDNILLMKVGDDPDFAKLLDFGVAKVMEGSARSTRSALSLTQAGMVFGTPEFMSPEQACGKELDPRSDLYSLAATMFAMLTGCGMYNGKSAIEWLTHHARTPAPHLTDALASLDAYPELDRLLQHCFAKYRDDRPGSAAELVRMIEAIEPTLGQHGREKPTTPNRPMHAAPSAYFAALPEDTLIPAAGPAVAAPATTSSESAVPPRGRRGLWLALGALAVVGMIVATVVVASRDRPPRRDLIAAAAHDARPGAAPADAAAIAIAPPDATSVAVVPPDAAPAPPPHTHLPRPPDPRIAEHLAAADEAYRAGNYLKQLTEAQTVLDLDRTNPRALFLKVDGEIKGKDFERACKDLRALGRTPVAHDLAQRANCVQ